MSGTEFADLDALARLVGQVPARDWSDEHDRLDLYRSALRNGVDDDRLRALLRGEPDDLVVSDVLAEAIYKASPEAGERWLDVAPPSAMDFLKKRLREILLLRGVAGFEDGGASYVAAVLDGSNWLQIRVAENSPRRDVLMALAKDGRTKRIRNIAANRAATRASRG